MGHAALDGVLNGLAGEKSVNEAGGKTVPAADAIVDFDFALRNVDDLALVERNRAPGVAGGGVRGAQGAGDELEIRVGGGYFAEHLLVGGDGEFGEVFADALDMHAKHGGEVLF